MSIYGRIEDDLRDALKSGDKNRVSVLRMIKSAIKNREIEKGEPPTDEDVQAVLMSFAKKANESIEQFSKAGRTDLAEKERAELAVVRQYLPEQLDEDRIREIVRETIDETGAAGVKDMGRVMKAVMAKIRGQADGRLVNNIVRKMLEA
ncbi:MAG: GatB/YqeY domain-containing protein [Deferribacteres bacterium]|nr:GatB/YqeY domain-containing protein [Deferribacteres bacterium]